MRKGDLIEATIEEIRFPNRGVFTVKDAQRDSAGDIVGDVEVIVKNALPGEKVRVRITKKHGARADGMLLDVLEPSEEELPSPCPVFGRCGGCLYLTLPPARELKIKEQQIRRLLGNPGWYEGVLESPVTEGYRNKMELTFGDEVKDGPMTLGMHRRGSFYDVTNADECRIVNEDYRQIIRTTRNYWTEKKIPFYHRMQQKGYLRHLLIREGMKTGDILVDLVTTTQTEVFAGQDKEITADSAVSRTEQKLLAGWVQTLLALPLDGHYAGILHTHNDAIADVVEDQGTEVLYGKDSFEEDLLGLHFKVTPFSFFQTNSQGAELLYETARNMICSVVSGNSDAVIHSAVSGNGGSYGNSERKPVIFDLYCGTGTISQLVSSIASKVIGVEIVEEAVEAARENARRNGITNCEFIAGDVLKVLDTIAEKPDFIILDPPRDGVHPKALPKILAYDVRNILYISCKPTSLARDLPIMRQQGYEPVRGVSINQFPKTANIETVVLLCKRNFKADSHVKLSVDMDEYRKIKSGEKA